MAIYRDGGPAVSSQRKKTRRIKPVVVGVVVFLILAFITFWWLRSDTADPLPTTSDAVSLGDYDPTQLFETPFYTFNAPKAWIFMPDLSTANKFVYRDIAGQNINGLLTVYVNNKPVPDEMWFTNIVPTSVRGQTELSADKTSEHCKSVVADKKSRNPQPVKLETVSFTCHTDGTNFYAAAGEIEGTPEIKMTREDGSIVMFVITYRNTAFSPNTSALQQVVNTFRSR